MTLLLMLALAPLALLCSLALAGVMTLGGLMHLVAAVGRASGNAQIERS